MPRYKCSFFNPNLLTLYLVQFLGGTSSRSTYCERLIQYIRVTPALTFCTHEEYARERKAKNAACSIIKVVFHS